MDRGAWRLQAPVGPALRHGLVASIPVGAALLVDLQLDLALAGALSTAALLGGFVAFDAPPAARVVWQLLTAPAIGVGAAMGALTGDVAWLATVTMAVFAAIAGIMVAVSLRLAIAGLTATLALLLAQGLAVQPDQALDALALGVAGVVLDAVMSAVSMIWTPAGPRVHPIDGTRAAWRMIRANLNLVSPSFRHALRFGVAMSVGVATYHVLDLGEHGYWIPLTVLFVLKPGVEQTHERIAMRAAGTVVGLVLATPIALAIGGLPVLEAVAVAVAAAFSFALLAIEYALFTTAITSFAIIISHALGESAWLAADERAAGTAIGIAIAAVSFALWGNRTVAPAAGV